MSRRPFSIRILLRHLSKLNRSISFVISIERIRWLARINSMYKRGVVEEARHCEARPWLTSSSEKLAAVLHAISLSSLTRINCPPLSFRIVRSLTNIYIYKILYRD